MTNAKIARRIHMSEGTVKFCLARAMSQTGVVESSADRCCRRRGRRRLLRGLRWHVGSTAPSAVPRVILWEDPESGSST
ncbi:hypothetical protein [Citricoccus muralis]|uniref:hypothetical protein n=1 Tax=Citricoccus muralis TaxID=169134 RepID=UPI003D6BCC24